MKANNVNIKEITYSKSKKSDWVVITMDASLEARGAFTDILDGAINIDEFNDIVDDLTSIEITKHHFGNNKKLSSIFIKGFHTGQSIYEERTSIVPMNLYKEFIEAIN